jgi:hypothetical protein
MNPYTRTIEADLTEYRLDIEKPAIALLNIPYPVTFRATFPNPAFFYVVRCTTDSEPPEAFSFTIHSDGPSHSITLNRSQRCQKLEEVIRVEHTIKAEGDDAVFAPGDPQRLPERCHVKWEHVFSTQFLNLEDPVRAWVNERTILQLRIKPRLGLGVEVVGIEATEETSTIDVCPISLPLMLLDREAFNIILLVTPSSDAVTAAPVGNVNLTFRVPGRLDGTYSWTVELPRLRVHATQLRVDLDVPPICQRLARQRLQLRITNSGSNRSQAEMDISDQGEDNVAFVIEGFLTAHIVIEPREEYLFEVAFVPIRDGECTFPKISVYEEVSRAFRWCSEPTLFVTSRP